MDLTNMRSAVDWLGDGLPGILDRVREGTYGAPGQPTVYYEDGSTWRDLTDLYTVLDQERGNGTPNLENSELENMLATVKGGYPLTVVQIGMLKRLLAKYQPAVDALRAKDGKEGQDYSAVPDPGTARLVTGGGV